MKIVVTGASGFLGRRVVARLAQGAQVFALMREAGAQAQRDLPAGALAVPGSLGTTDGLRDLPPAVDCVVHLAQSREYRHFPAGMRDMVGVNVAGTFELLEYARRAGSRQFIYTSTGSIYGPTPGRDQKEGHDEQPRQAYPVTKYCGELLLAPYAQIFSTLSLRLYFLYGPGQRDMLIAKLIERIAAGEPVSLQGPGGGLELCPTHVDDVAEVIATAIATGATGVVNVATPERLTLEQVAAAIARGLGVAPRFERIPGEIPAVFRPSLDRLRAWYDLERGFRPFAAGVAATLAPGSAPRA